MSAEQNITRDEKTTITHSEYRGTLTFAENETEAVIRGLVDIINDLEREIYELKKSQNRAVDYGKFEPPHKYEDLLIELFAEAPKKNPDGSYVVDRPKVYAQHVEELYNGLREPFGNPKKTYYRVARAKLQREREPDVRLVDANRGRNILAYLTNFLAFYRDQVRDTPLYNEFDAIINLLTSVMQESFSVTGVFNTRLIYSLISYIAAKVLGLRSKKINKGESGKLGYVISDDVYDAIAGSGAFDRVLQARRAQAIAKLSKISPTTKTAATLQKSINNIDNILETREISSNDLARDLISSLTSDVYINTVKNKNKKDGKEAYKTLMTQIANSNTLNQNELINYLDAVTKEHRKLVKEQDELAALNE